VQDLDVIDCVDHSMAYQRWTLEDPRVRDCAWRARFLIHSQLRWIRLDHPMLTVLIEIWRPKTSTFDLWGGRKLLRYMIWRCYWAFISMVQLSQKQMTEIGCLSVRDY